MVDPSSIIRVATYNIHKGMSSVRRHPRVSALKVALTELAADLVFLQEVQEQHDRHSARYGHHPQHTPLSWPKQSQSDFLAGDAYYSAYGKNAIYKQGHHGNALLSRFPFLASSNLDVSDHVFESRGILHCVVQMSGIAVHCYVVHLGLFAGSRMRQTEALIRQVQESALPHEPVIIAGDFNDWRNHVGNHLRKDLGVREVFDQVCSETTVTHPPFWHRLRRWSAGLTPARTFPAQLPWLRMDRIYVRGFLVESAQVQQGKRWRKLSDHVPIIATLRLAI